MIRMLTIAALGGGLMFMATAVNTAADAQAARRGDAARGRMLFARCAACHKLDRNGVTGPMLGGVVGRKAAGASGFRYSRALTAANLTWDDKNLDAFLTAPMRKVPGTSMPISVPAPQDRADLIAFLKGSAPTR
jgi:cytochrome c